MALKNDYRTSWLRGYQEVESSCTGGRFVASNELVGIRSQAFGCSCLVVEKASSPLARLIRSKPANKLLHKDASKENANIIHVLLLHGVDPNIQNNDGDTALHLAVFGGYEP